MHREFCFFCVLLFFDNFLLLLELAAYTGECNLALYERASERAKRTGYGTRTHTRTHHITSQRRGGTRLAGLREHKNTGFLYKLDTYYSRYFCLMGLATVGAGGGSAWLVGWGRLRATSLSVRLPPATGYDDTIPSYIRTSSAIWSFCRPSLFSTHTHTCI